MLSSLISVSVSIIPEHYEFNAIHFCEMQKHSKAFKEFHTIFSWRLIVIQRVSLEEKNISKITY